MSFPSIPDNVYKFLLFVGLVIIGYSYIEDIRFTDYYNNKIALYSNDIDSFNIETKKIAHQSKRILEKAAIIGIRNKIESPITPTDTGITFRLIETMKLQKKEVGDSVYKIWREFKEKDFELDIFRQKLEDKKNVLLETQKEWKSRHITNIFFFFGGFALLFLGFIGMQRHQEVQEELLQRQLLEKPKFYLFCQSCGKNFTAILKKGKNLDGSENHAFCNKCYDNGVFIEENLTYEEFVIRANTELDKNRNWLKKRRLSNRFKSLERWTKDEYF